MSTNNKVFQVLVPSGNKAIAAVGSSLESLTPGQIGFFDEETKLAIDGSAASATDRIFIAVGRDEDIDLSAGQTIPLNLLEAITVKDAQDAVNQKQLIAGFDNIENQTDYTLRMEVRNGKIAQTIGTVGFYKSVSFRTSTVTSQKDFVKKFIEVLDLASRKEDSFFKATVVNATTLAVITDIDAQADTVKFGILIESLPVKETIFPGGVNPVYFKNRQSTIELSLVENLSDTGAKITETTASKHAEGKGYDLHQLEYQAMGWKTNHIYRTSDVTGLELPGAVYQIDSKGSYNTINLTYENKGYAGWSSYKHPIQTIIAVPKADTTTYTAIKTVLQNIAGVTNPVTE